MANAEDDDAALRSAALQNAQSILAARRRAEQELIVAKEALERKTDELRQQTEWLRVALGSIGDAVIAVDTDRRISFLNTAGEELTGWSATEVTGRLITEVMVLVHEITRETVPSPSEQVFTTGEVVALGNHTLLIRRDGREIPIEDSAAPIRNPGGELIGVIMVFHDVSVRWLKEKELAQSQQRFRLLSTVAPHLLWTADADGAADYLNDRWYDYTGQTPAEGLGHGWAEALHAEDRDMARECWLRAVETGAPYEVEYRLRGKDGQYRWFVSRGVPFRAEDGSITAWYGSVTDIHQRRLTAEALREESVITEQLFEVANALSAELDLQRVVQIITDAGTKVTRAQFGAFFYNATGPDGNSLLLYSLSGAPAEAFAKFPMPRATAIFGPTFRGEGVIRLDDVRKDPRFGRNAPYHGMPEGHLPVVSYLAVPVISRSGEVIGGLFFGHAQPGVFTERDERMTQGIAAQAAAAIDTARLYQAEQQARAAAEAANVAKDRFLAMLSHELRTPLTPVLMVATALETSSDLPPAMKNDMAMIRRNVELEAKLIDDLLDLSRVASGKLTLRLDPVDINETVGHVCSICRAGALEKDIDLTCDLDPKVGWIEADSARLQQILWNLVNNALKFTQQGGRVEIATRHRDDHLVELQVRDNGRGIEPDLLPHIFDAFEQGPVGVTRHFGGLGLGLAISKALVGLHHGTLTAGSSGPGQGASFTVLLPAVLPAEPSPPVIPAPLLPAEVSPLRLLVVEDHADTVRALGILLRRAGFHVITACSVADALKAVREQPFDVIVSDLGLPDGTGYEFMRQVQENHKIPGIAMSGYGMEEDLAKSQAAGFTEHLVKPISVTKLAEAIRRLTATD